MVDVVRKKDNRYKSAHQSDEDDGYRGQYYRFEQAKDGPAKAEEG